MMGDNHTEERWPHQPTPDIKTEFYLMIFTSMFGIFLILFLILFAE